MNTKDHTLWKKSKKGMAAIWTHPELKNAIVNRKGFGLKSAMGNSITFEGKSFPNLDNAKWYALNHGKRRHK